MSDKKSVRDENFSSSHSSRRKKNPSKVYVFTVLSFVLIAVIAMIGTAFALINPATRLVHSAEELMSMNVCDVTVSDSADNNGTMQYGNKLAKITCDDNGINCNVYYGSNRASFRNGAGLDGNFGLFNQGKNIVAGAYDSTYFASLKKAQKGDVFKVYTNGGVYEYKVTETAFADKNADVIRESGNERLILYSIFSDFSENSGKRFYVFADKVNKGGND